MTEKTIIDDFTWDENDPTITNEEDIKVEKKEDTEEIEETEEDDIEEEDFEWKDEDNEEDEDEDEDNEEDEDEEINKIPQFLKERAEKLEINLEEEEFENEEEILDSVVEATVESKIKDMFDELPDLAKSFNNFVINGGDPLEFIKEVKSTVDSGIDFNTELKNEEDYEKALRLIFKEREYDEEDIKLNIETFKDAGTLEKVAKREFKAWKNSKLKDLSLKADSEALNRKSNEKKNKQFFKDFEKYVKDVDEVAGLSVSHSDKKDLTDFIYKPNIKHGDKVVSGLQKKLSEVFQDKEKTVALALLLKDDLDLKRVTRKLKSKIIKDAKKGLKDKKKINHVNNKSAGTKRLSDYFAD